MGGSRSNAGAKAKGIHGSCPGMGALVGTVIRTADKTARAGAPATLDLALALALGWGVWDSLMLGRVGRVVHGAAGHEPPQLLSQNGGGAHHMLPVRPASGSRPPPAVTEDMNPRHGLRHFVPYTESTTEAEFQLRLFIG